MTGKIKNEELFNLDTTILEFTLPRLKKFKEKRCGYPCDLTDKKWDKVLGKMVWAIERHLGDDDISIIHGSKEAQKVEEGLALFFKYFFNLWI